MEAKNLIKKLNKLNASYRLKDVKEELGYVATEWDADGMRP